MRRTGMWALGVLAVCPVLLAQQGFQQPSPKLPENILGPPLVAWSYLQKPSPVPQPLPPPQTDPGRPPKPAEPQDQQHTSALQAFTGTIMKQGSQYVLKVSDNLWYQIDDQEKARAYEGREVKIAGTLDTKTNVLHITSIQLSS